MENQKKKGGCLKWGLIAVAIIVAIGVIGSAGDDKSDESSNAQTATSTVAVTPTEKPVEYIEVNADDLLSAYEDNTVAADNEYKDKMLKITGVVKDIGKDVLDEAYVTFEGENEFSIATVQCYFAKDNLDDIAQIHPGDTVTISGKCDGETFNVIIKNCNLEQ